MFDAANHTPYIYIYTLSSGLCDEQTTSEHSRKTNDRMEKKVRRMQEVAVLRVSYRKRRLQTHAENRLRFSLPCHCPTN